MNKINLAALQLQLDKNDNLDFLLYKLNDLIKRRDDLYLIIENGRIVKKDIESYKPSEAPASKETEKEAETSVAAPYVPAGEESFEEIKVRTDLGCLNYCHAIHKTILNF